MRKNRKESIAERLIERSKADLSFDIDFWQKAGARARFIAMWKAVGEFYKIRGMDGNKLRLQRSIQSVEQI